MGKTFCTVSLDYCKIKQFQEYTKESQPAGPNEVICYRMDRMHSSTTTPSRERGGYYSPALDSAPQHSDYLDLCNKFDTATRLYQEREALLKAEVLSLKITLENQLSNSTKSSHHDLKRMEEAAGKIEQKEREINEKVTSVMQKNGSLSSELKREKEEHSAVKNLLQQALQGNYQLEDLLRNTEAEKREALVKVSESAARINSLKTRLDLNELDLQEQRVLLAQYAQSFDAPPNQSAYSSSASPSASALVDHVSSAHYHHHHPPHSASNTTYSSHHLPVDSSHAHASPTHGVADTALLIQLNHLKRLWEKECLDGQQTREQLRTAQTELERSKKAWTVAAIDNTNKLHEETERNERQLHAIDASLQHDKDVLAEQRAVLFESNACLTDAVAELESKCQWWKELNEELRLKLSQQSEEHHVAYGKLVVAGEEVEALRGFSREMNKNLLEANCKKAELEREVSALKFNMETMSDRIAELTRPPSPSRDAMTTTDAFAGGMIVQAPSPTTSSTIINSMKRTSSSAALRSVPSMPEWRLVDELLHQGIPTNATVFVEERNKPTPGAPRSRSPSPTQLRGRRASSPNLLSAATTAKTVSTTSPPQQQQRRQRTPSPSFRNDSPPIGMHRSASVPSNNMNTAAYLPFSSPVAPKLSPGASSINTNRSPQELPFNYRNAVGASHDDGFLDIYASTTAAAAMEKSPTKSSRQESQQGQQQPSTPYRTNSFDPSNSGGGNSSSEKERRSRSVSFDKKNPPIIPSVVHTVDVPPSTAAFMESHNHSSVPQSPNSSVTASVDVGSGGVHVFSNADVDMPSSSALDDGNNHHGKTAAERAADHAAAEANALLLASAHRQAVAKRQLAVGTYAKVSSEQPNILRGTPPSVAKLVREQQLRYAQSVPQLRPPSPPLREQQESEQQQLQMVNAKILHSSPSALLPKKSSWKVDYLMSDDRIAQIAAANNATASLKKKNSTPVNVSSASPNPTGWSPASSTKVTHLARHESFKKSVAEKRATTPEGQQRRATSPAKFSTPAGSIAIITLTTPKPAQNFNASSASSPGSASQVKRSSSPMMGAPTQHSMPNRRAVPVQASDWSSSQYELASPAKFPPPSPPSSSPNRKGAAVPASAAFDNDKEEKHPHSQ